MRLFNSSIIERKKTRLNDIINQRYYWINQSKSKFDLSIAKSIITLIRIRFIASCTRLIRLCIHLLDIFFQQLHEHFYLFICSTISSAIARTFYSLQFEKEFEIHAFASQINVFFSISFETIFRFVRQHFIYFICSTIFFNNRSNNHLHYNSK